MVQIRVSCFLFFLFFCNGAYSQNLITNGGFEEHEEDQGKRKFQQVKGWEKKGSPDLFFVDSLGRGTVPHNFMGWQKPHKGDSYAGLIVYLHLKYFRDYREFIISPLKEPLKHGQVYRLSLYVSLADTCIFTSDGLEVAFSNKVFLDERTKSVVSPEAKPLRITKNFIEEKENWVHLSRYYVAKGGERFMVIGNFKDHSMTPYKQVTKTHRRPIKANGEIYASYFYVDEVSLELLPPAEGFKNRFKINPRWSLGTMKIDGVSQSAIYVNLNRVLFDWDKFAILKSALPEINRVYSILEADSTLSMVILGHTDITGNATYNKKLSLKRATSVKDFLVAQGIPETRIIIKGLGSNDPIANNNSQKGRKLNRRVDFAFFYKTENLDSNDPKDSGK